MDLNGMYTKNDRGEKSKQGANMRAGRTIRSELVANREDRGASRRRVQEMAFGVYRPLSEDSRQQIQAVLDSAKTRVDDHFGGAGSKYTELIIPKDHGVTYVRREHVLKALKTSALKNFSFHRVRNDIANYNYRHEDTPTVPIEGLDWYGRGNLKLVGKFAVANAEARELAEESERIGMFLEEAGGQGLDVYEPDHVTLCSFRRSTRGHSLAESQKYDVQAIIREELAAAHIGAVTLEQVVVGSSYRQPLIPELAPATF